jgi:hypothetical protein
VAVDSKEKVDVTEDQLRTLVRQEIKNALDSQARRVRGISSFEVYLEALLQAARKD